MRTVHSRSLRGDVRSETRKLVNLLLSLSETYFYSHHDLLIISLSDFSTAPEISLVSRKLLLNISAISKSWQVI